MLHGSGAEQGSATVAIDRTGPWRGLTASCPCGCVRRTGETGCRLGLRSTTLPQGSSRTFIEAATGIEPVYRALHAVPKRPTGSFSQSHPRNDFRNLVKWKQLRVSEFTFALALVAPVLTVARALPQAVRIYRSGAAGVARGTWILNTAMAELWFGFGVVVRVPAEIGANVPNALMGGLVVFLAARAQRLLKSSLLLLLLFSSLAIALPVLSVALKERWILNLPATLGSTILYLPQMLNVLRQRNLEGVSVITWFIAFAAAVSWWIYGALIDQPPIWIPSLILAPSSLVIIGRLLLFERRRRNITDEPALDI